MEDDLTDQRLKSMLKVICAITPLLELCTGSQEVQHVGDKGWANGLFGVEQDTKPGRWCSPTLLLRPIGRTTISSGTRRTLRWIQEMRSLMDGQIGAGFVAVQDIYICFG
jgi:hypothetical protein